MFEIIIEAYRWFFLQLAGVVGLGWGIVALSFITSAAMMPLMKAVAGVVRRETEYQSVILPQIADINKRYATDMERNHHVQRLYARYAYSPLSAVKKVLPLFVQIPFLLLTYFMLKGTEQLAGVSFHFLRDLGQPDGLLSMFGINVLPLVMTGVNVLTVFATPGFTARDWSQAIGIAFLFLVMLYTAPSALLLYWTLNNSITLVRTLMENNRKGLHLLLNRVYSIKQLFVQKTYAMLSYSLVLMALYFCVTSKLMMDVDGGFTCNIMYRSMVFVVGMAAIATFILLTKEAKANTAVLWLSFVVCIGFPLSLLVAYVSSRLIFMRYMEWVDLFVVVPCLIVVCLLPYLFRRERLNITYLQDNYGAIVKEWWILLLPLILAIHYGYASKTFSLPISSLLLLIVYMTIPCLVLFLCSSALFRKWISTVSLFKISTGFFVGIYLIPMISTETGFFAYSNNIVARILMIIMSVLTLLCVKNRKFGMVFSSVLLSFVIVNSFCGHKETDKFRQNDKIGWQSRLASVIGDDSCIKTNNVYILAYDAYGHRSILDGLELQDDEIYEELKKNGYTLYDAYSTGADTISSMSEMFTLNGVGGEERRATICGDNIFCDFLRKSGYRTSYILLGYLNPTKDKRKPGDYYFPGEAKTTRPEQVLFPCILRGSLSQSPSIFDQYSFDEWLDEKDRAIINARHGPSFVYAHTELPFHAPWEPRYRKSDREEQQLYSERLKKANDQICKDINMLKNDPEAIVVLMSDHGGSLLIPEKAGQYDVRHLIDHFGIFLAIKWPSDYKPTLKIDCLQNVLLEVMIYLSGDKNLCRLINEGETEALEYPLGVPAGIIKNGVIQYGAGKGENIFNEAYRAFGIKRQE